MKTQSIFKCYNIRIGDKKIRVCEKVIHGISGKRIENIAKHISHTKAVTPKPDGRRKHNNRLNKVSDETVNKVQGHINSVSTRESHYSRKDNNKRTYLPADLDINEMHLLYLQKHPEFPVSKDFYFQYFKTNFNLRLDHPRSDTCQKCDNLQKELSTLAITQERRKELDVEEKLHQAKAQLLFEDINDNGVLAESNGDVEMLCFDYRRAPVYGAFIEGPQIIDKTCRYQKGHQVMHFIKGSVGFITSASHRENLGAPF